MARVSTWFLVSLIVCASPAGAAIIDHASVDAVASLPQATMDAIGQQRWFFSHASVGSNMVSGMNALHSADPTRYQLTVASAGYNSASLQANNPPATTAPGTVYECSRGNPGWANKISIFENSLNVAGWNAPAVDVVLDKMCYIDQTANVTSYLSSMTALEAAHPDTVVVYATMPLMTSTDSNNTLRNQYNNAVRQHCAGSDRVLFDIADMEAHDPSGNAVTYSSGGSTYQRMYNAYSDDGGHLNTLGRQQIATGWYAVAASILGDLPEPCIDPIPGDADCSGAVDMDDFVILKQNFGLVGGAEWSQGDFDGNGAVTLVDFTILKQHFGQQKVLPEPATGRLPALGLLGGGR